MLLTILSSILAALDKVFGYVSKAQIAKTVAESKVEIASIQATSEVEKKWSFVAWCIPLFAAPFILYAWKAVAWDKVMGPSLGFHSSTDPIQGALGIVFSIIVSGLFLHAVVK